MADVEQLINAVRRRPELWDKRKKIYHNKEAVRETWNQVAKECKVDSEIAKAKWKNLRDTFRYTMKKIPLQTPGNENTSTVEPKWIWYPHLSFLEDVIHCRWIKNDIKKEDEHESEYNPALSDYLVSSLEEQESHVPDNNSEKIDTTPLPQNKKRKISGSDNNDTVEQQACPPEMRDDSYHFVISLLPILRKLPAQSQMRARMKMLQILLDELEKSNVG